MDWSFIILLFLMVLFLYACWTDIRDSIKHSRYMKEQEQERIVRMLKEGANYGRTDWTGPR